MDVAIQNRHCFVGREQVHHVVAVAREPFPFRFEIEKRTMGEDDDRRRLRKSREIFFQPRDLFSADGGTSKGHVVEGDEMNAAMIERVMRLAEVFAEERAAVERGIVLARNVMEIFYAELR